MMSETRQALVTGAGRGLGREIVNSLVARGWEVWATDIVPIDPAATRAQHVDVLDVGDPAAIERVIAANTRGFDGLVNNAAIFPLAKWDELDVETWRRALEINLTGPFLCCQAMGRAMRGHGRGGAIVNISSVTWFQGMPTGMHYTAAKGGIVGITRSFARALGKHRIRVNCVAPGIMRTEGVMELVGRGMLPEQRVMMADDPERMLPGQTEPAGVADVIAFLLSDDARELTGQHVVASGGTHFN